jgi:hypothetical protein
MIILVTFVEFHNFLLSLMPIQKFSVAVLSLSNLRNLGLLIQKQLHNIKRPILHLPVKINTWLFWATHYLQKKVL